MMRRIAIAAMAISAAFAVYFLIVRKFWFAFVAALVCYTAFAVVRVIDLDRPGSN